MSYLTDAIVASRQFDPVWDELDEGTRRQLHLLRLAGLPAPQDAAKAEELAQITSKMESIYGKGKVCRKTGRGKADKCMDLLALDDILRESRNPKELLWVWESWRDAVGRAEKPLYTRFVELANEGAPGGRVRQPRRHVALGLRHEPRRVRPGSRPAVRGGEAPL